jgi:hypothetical protein
MAVSTCLRCAMWPALFRGSVSDHKVALEPEVLLHFLGLVKRTQPEMLKKILQRTGYESIELANPVD